MTREMGTEALKRTGSGVVSRVRFKQIQQESMSLGTFAFKAFSDLFRQAIANSLRMRFQQYILIFHIRVGNPRITAVDHRIPRGTLKDLEENDLGFLKGSSFAY